MIAAMSLRVNHFHHIQEQEATDGKTSSGLWQASTTVMNVINFLQ